MTIDSHMHINSIILDDIKKEIADIKEMSCEEVEKITNQNTKRLFKRME